MALFEWSPGGRPPFIEEHSLAKLAVFRDYLSCYINRLCVGSSRDTFKLDLVDGFCGGGLFSDLRGEVSGTPLIMLEEVECASDLLNANRTKPLSFDVKFHFNDVNPDHVAYLRRVLAERSGSIPGDKVRIYPPSSFDVVVNDIIDDVLRRQPRAGRAVFLLDQTGFREVDLTLVRRILDRLPNAEVILTIAVDVLINFMSDRPEFYKCVAPLGIDRNEVLSLLAAKDTPAGRAAVERLLCEMIRVNCGATYYTPFFIKPEVSRRALWFVHLSRHPVARDVMMQCHWRNYNSFEHYGLGGFNMMGWDSLRDGSIPIWNFDEFDAEQLHNSLVSSLPTRLLEIGLPLSVEEFHTVLGNSTAGRFDDLDRAVLALSRAGDVDILAESGKFRSREIRRLNSSDRINFTVRPMFSGMSFLSLGMC